MVRNTASTPNLANNMDSKTPSAQITPNDAYTKALMNRVATGEATHAEHMEFNEFVTATLQGRSQTHPPPPPAPDAQPSGPSLMKTDPLSVFDNEGYNDYQMQLKLLEEQNKKRLHASVQDEDDSQALPPLSSVPSVPNPNHALQDYQMQLMLAEQQNKKRLLMQKQAHDASQAAPLTYYRPTALPTHQPFTWSNAASLPAHQDSTMPPWLLEQQNEKRLLMARLQQKGTPAQMSPLSTFPASQPEAQVPNQDYQLQLQMLESQNRKRLSMARNGQNQVDFPAAVVGGQTETSNSHELESAKEAEKPPKREHELISEHSLGQPPAKELSKLSLAEKQMNKKQKAKAAPKTLEIPPEVVLPRANPKAAAAYCKPFCNFMTDNPTVFHAVAAQRKELLDLGWKQLDERSKWDIVPGGRYFVERNGSSMLAFSVGENYKPGNGCAIVAGHVDAVTTKLKPISTVPSRAGYIQLGVAPYAGGLSNTWWDRDLGIGGRVLVRQGGKIVTKLVKLDWPIARVPSLAAHFGAAAAGPFNKETQMVPIIGLEGTEASHGIEPFSQPSIIGGEHGPVGSFINSQPPLLVKAITDALDLKLSRDETILSWELELFDVQPATVGGLNKDFIFAGRIDDKLCSWAAMQALLSGQQWNDAKYSSVIKMVGWFDDEEIGSGLRQGARSNFLPQTIERIVGCLGKGKTGPNLVGRTYANSFLVSSDVTHAVNPNFLGQYLDGHAPHLNVGVAASADANGHMTTDAVSTAIFQRCAESVGAKLQIFHPRNDTSDGGTIGPMLSTMTGIRAIDVGIPQLSMHSIRATTGSLDPGLGVITFMGFFNRFEHVDKEFRSD